MNLILSLALSVIYHSSVKGEEGLSYIGDVEVEEGHFFQYQLTEEDIDWEQGWEVEAVEWDTLSYLETYPELEEASGPHNEYYNTEEDEKIQQLEELKKQLMKLVDWGWLKYSTIVDRIVTGDLDHLVQDDTEEAVEVPEVEVTECDFNLVIQEEFNICTVQDVCDELMKYLKNTDYTMYNLIKEVIQGKKEGRVEEHENSENSENNEENEECECDFSEEIVTKFDICIVKDVNDKLMKCLKNHNYSTYSMLKEVIQRKKEGQSEAEELGSSGCDFSEEIVTKFDICIVKDVNDKLMKCLKNHDYSTYQNIKSIMLAQRAKREDRFWSLAKKYSAGYPTKSTAGLSKPYTAPTTGDLASKYCDNLAKLYLGGYPTTYSDNLAMEYEASLAKMYSAGYATAYQANLAQEYKPDLATTYSDSLAKFYSAIYATTYKADLATSYKAHLAASYKADLATSYKAHLAASYKALAKVKEYNVALSHTNYYPAPQHKSYASLVKPRASLVKPRACLVNQRASLVKQYSSIVKPYCELVKPRACPLKKELCRPVKNTSCAKLQVVNYYAVKADGYYSAKTEMNYAAKTHKQFPAKTHKSYATVTQNNVSAPSPKYYPAPVSEPDHTYPTGFFYNKWIGILPFTARVKILDPSGAISDDESEYEILDDNDEGAISDQADNDEGGYDEADEYFSDTEREQYDKQMRDEQFDDENIEWGDEEYENEW